MQYLCVIIPPAVRPTLLQHMDLGSLTCARIWVRAIHAKGGQALTRVESEGQKKIVPHPVPPGYQSLGFWTGSLMLCH